MKIVPAKVWIPAAIVAGGALLSFIVVTTGPEAPRRSPQRSARLVDVMTLEPRSAQVVVEAMGTVLAAEVVEMRAQVFGAVVEMNPSLVPGGHLKEGETAIRIDPRDYELALVQRRSEVARAEENLKLEQAQQSIARREYELLGEVVSEEDIELILRQPQLQTAIRAQEAASANLEKAELDLERTRLLAPFNASVLEKRVGTGTVVNSNTVLATLVGTDVFWIEVLVPTSELKWITVPGEFGQPGSMVRIRQPAVWGADASREGRVMSLLSSLESMGRLSRILVEVRDPLSLLPGSRDKPALLVESFVEVEILGPTLEAAVVIPRRYIRDGSQVWLVDENGRLRINTLEPLHSGKDEVLVVDGLVPGQRLVTSEIASPVDGMELRVRGSSPRGGNGPEASE